jgi:glycosyltransferase involved in cell wall biosynthesis
MHILQLTDADVFAGTERLMLELSASLADHGVQATLGCPPVSPLAERGPTEKIPIFPVGLPRQPKGGRADATTIQRLRKAFREKQFDIVHVHNGRSALIAALAGAGKTVPMVMTQHFLSPARTTRRGLRGWASRRLHTWLQTRITRHSAISEAVRQAAIAAHIAHPDQIEVVYNGIRPPSVPSTSLVRQREAWIAEADPFIFCAARAEPEKDLPTLIEAFQRIAHDFPRAQCAIAGTGRELDALRTTIENSGIAPGRLRLLGFRSDVAELMAACDLFVLPAPAEPFGLVLLEAMALGKPVIACDAGGPPEIVARNVSGLLVPPRSPAAFAEALATLCRDRELRQRMGETGHARFQQHFTADRMAAQFANFYRAILNPR